MREWILAMLGISALLLIRNMAKIISQGRKNVLVETIYENHPQKLKMEKYAHLQDDPRMVRIVEKLMPVAIM